MNYKGYYLNLDRNTERRSAFEDHLARFSLKQRYKRLRAADGNEEKVPTDIKDANVIGHFLSHVWAVREGLSSGHNLHIVEDDIIFDLRSERALEWAASAAQFDNFDLLFTDIALPLTNDIYRAFKAHYDRTVTLDETGAIKTIKYEMLNFKEMPHITTGSYLVNKASVSKIRRMYEDELSAGIKAPFADFLRGKAGAGELKIGCLFPFVTSIKIEETSPLPKRELAANIGRYSFFTGCNWDDCDMYINSHAAQPEMTDRQGQALKNLLGFSILGEPKKTTP